MNNIKSIISHENFGGKKFGNTPTGTIEEINNSLPPGIIKNLESKKYYNIIKEFVNSLEVTGTLYRSSGHCVGISDMVRKLLADYNIRSRLVECNLAVIKRTPNEPNSVNLIGYNRGEDVDPEIDVPTHVVCITETEIPILLDLSISGIIGSKINFIMAPLIPDLVQHEKNILTLDLGHSIWVYNERKENTLIDLHEKSIIDRINMDLNILNRIKNINRVIFAISILITLNFLRGTYDFHQKYINKENNWGPTVNQLYNQ